MNKMLKALITTFAIIFVMTACGEDSELASFKVNINNFCKNLSTLDTAINKIDPTADNATSQLVNYMEQMNDQFKALASLDFPEEFDYLEGLSDEAGKYMSEAAQLYKKAYADNEFDQSASDSALKKYKQAYKRIELILIYLHGDEPREEDLITD